MSSSISVVELSVRLNLRIDIYKSAFTGAAFVQTSKAAIGADEFLAMVKQCGLNRLLQYATWLSALIDVARKNDEVLKALQGMRQVMYTGLAMNPEDEAWAFAHDIPLTVSNFRVT